MRHFAVIGHPIAHSRSPEIHQVFAQQMGIAIAYRRLEAPVVADGSGFADVTRAFFASGGVGMNVTAPFKEAAFCLASDVSERSRLAAAANTLTADGENGWHADNTDGIGLVRDLTGRLGFPLAGQRLLILGAGGASAGILGPLLDARPAQIVLWNRSADKARRLVHRFSDAYPDAALSVVSADIRSHGVFSCNPAALFPAPLPQARERRSSSAVPQHTGEGRCSSAAPQQAGAGSCSRPRAPLFPPLQEPAFEELLIGREGQGGDGAPSPASRERGNMYSEEMVMDQESFDLVIHATSLKEGLNTADEASAAWPWLNSLCAPDTFFYDLSYADNEETLFLRWVKARGACRWSDGFGMLVEQAAESFRIWHDCLPETPPVFAALRLKK
ncbi:MAG: hypothetical protein LBI35_04000 [Burkholderiales bacterium]|jgi:shikimate dehydrogenase|nr:hypothetical protein [Burkholderiales bacterium]